MGVIRPAHSFLYLHCPQERKERKTHASFFLFTATFSCLLKSNVSLDLGPNLIPGGSDRKEPACNVGDPASIPGSGRFPGEGQASPVLLPGESHGQRSLTGCSPWGQTGVRD